LLNHQALLAIAYIGHIARSFHLAVATSTYISNRIEMPDPLSATAAAVGLAQSAIKLCQEPSGFVSKLKEASAELQQVNRELEELTNTIAQIRNLIQTYRESDLLCGKGEVFNTIESGLKIVKEPSRRYDTMVNRFGNESSRFSMRRRFWRCRPGWLTIKELFILRYQLFWVSIP
jgi:hypothetical protein